MELSSSPMTERQRNYRATYRHRIAGWYNGWLHISSLCDRLHRTIGLFRQHQRPALVELAICR